LHPLEPFVIVRELLHVRKRDLAGEDRVVMRDVGLRVVGAVLEFDVHAGAELVDVEAIPVDADRVADARCLLCRRSPWLGHRFLLRASLTSRLTNHTSSRWPMIIGASFPRCFI